MNLGERIRELRKAALWSQEELAERLDVSRQTVSKWESGGTVPELDRLVMISELFGVSLDNLIVGEIQADRAEPDIEILAKENRRRSKIHTLTALGIGTMLISAMLFVFLYALNIVTTEIKYILYRYIAVGQWDYAYNAAEHAAPYIAALVIMLVGAVMILIAVLEKNKQIYKKNVM